jgi:hypothetical protein
MTEGNNDYIPVEPVRPSALPAAATHGRRHQLPRNNSIAARPDQRGIAETNSLGERKELDFEPDSACHYNKGSALRAQCSMPARTHGWLPLAAVVTASLCWPADAPSQTVISARAGLLNHISGCVLLDGKHLEPGRLRLTHLLSGQSLRTTDGHAEVMLGPEVFLRLGFESELEMVSTDLAAPQVRLLSGSALIDANGLTAREPVSILIGHNEVRLVRKGLYRLDIPSDGPEAVTVWNGRAVAVVGSREKTIEDRHTVELGENVKSLIARRVERPRNDALDDWSSERAAAIAKVNGEMLRKQIDEDHNDKHFGLPRLGRGIP